jgi:hypothetical protein
MTSTHVLSVEPRVGSFELLAVVGKQLLEDTVIVAQTAYENMDTDSR